MAIWAYVQLFRPLAEVFLPSVYAITRLVPNGQEVDYSCDSSKLDIQSG